MNTEVQALIEELEAKRAIHAAVWRLADQATRRAAEAWRRADDATRSADAAQRLADEEKQRAETSRLLLAGEYYSPIERVFSREAVEYNDAGMFEALRREKAPTFMERRQKQEPVETPSSYTLTLKKSMPSRFHQPARDDPSSVDTENEMCPADIFGTPDLHSEMGKLVPVTYDRASVYSDVTRCVLALEDDAKHDIQQAIHGSHEVQRRARIPYTGIKHSLLNQIRLPGQVLFFEGQPCVVIVPIMKLERMKDWNLEGYEAIVLAGACGTTTAAQAYRGIHMFQFEALATPHEIEIARLSLAQAVQGLAYSLVHRRSERREDSLEPAMRQLLESFRNDLHISAPQGKIFVPMRPRDGYYNLRVGQVSFQGHEHRARTPLTHPAPDPLLLLIKSAINWSMRNGQQLLVTGECPDEDNEDDSCREEENIEWSSDASMA
jgi:hypothetical protein